jgi:hypothetical protein
VSVGRPTSYTPELVDTICERLAQGQSLVEICRDGDMPSRNAVYAWLARHPEFHDKYARARQVQADAIFDEILEIADDASNDWMERGGEGDLGWQVNGENIQRSRLRIDARKWMAGKLKPKVYGERVLHGNDPDNPMPPTRIVIEAAKPDDDSQG